MGKLRAQVGLMALVLVLLSGAIAHARDIEMNVPKKREIWSELTFSFGGIVIIRCAVTLEGSFVARTFRKIPRARIGDVTAARVGHPCTGGEVWFLNGVERLSSGMTTRNTLPWALRYLGFAGMLPRISRIRREVPSFEFLGEALGVSCLYGATVERPLEISANIEGGGTITSLEVTGALPRKSGSELCPAEAQVSGSGIMTSETGAAVRPRLI